MSDLPPPRRTNITELSDDELLLFDFLFDKHLCHHHLRAENYPFHMNCGYSHGLGDIDLEKSLTTLVERGLLTCKEAMTLRIEFREFRRDKTYALTEAGGRLWELERCPDWDRFLATSTWELGINCRGMIRVVCSNESIGRLCLGSMFAAGLISPVSRIRVRLLRNVRLLPWKAFPRVNSIRYKINDNTNDVMFPAHWDVYNAGRCWWRDIAELDSLGTKTV